MLMGLRTAWTEEDSSGKVSQLAKNNTKSNYAPVRLHHAVRSRLKDNQ